MSDRPTPETDEQCYDCEYRGDMGGRFTADPGKLDPYGDHVSADFARKLERQRDEARENAKHWCDMHILAVKDFSQAQELARELRDALIALDEAPQDDHYEPSMKEIDAWVIARAALTKAKEVLP